MNKKLRVLIPVGVVAIAAVSFFGGMQVQKTLTKSSADTAQAGTGNGFSGGQFGGGRRSGQRPTFGQVTSINGSSMVVTDSSGKTVNVTISSSTQITDSSGNTADSSAIQANESVAVFGAAASDGSITAQRILLNPTTGGGPQSQPPTSAN